MASLLTMFCFVAFAQKTVTGTVKDANGEPMIGVTVATGTGTGAVTDMDGNFTIQNASPSTVLNISYVGYKSQSVKVGSSNALNIVLQEDNTTLEDVVVIGYGTMKRRDLTERRKRYLFRVRVFLPMNGVIHFRRMKEVPFIPCHHLR